jgi:hypothetical protein
MSKKNGQADEAFGTVADYKRALITLMDQGAPQKHWDMLREHYMAPKHTISWEALAAKVGYRGRSAVQLQYGNFAGRVADLFGIQEQPEGFWLYVLAKWSERPAMDAKGHTLFTLRAPVQQAMVELRLV